MPTAVQSHTPPTRRSAIGFSLAAMAAGLTVPALASAAKPDPDAELIALARQLDPQWQATEVIAAEGKFLPRGITPQSIDQEERLSDAVDEFWSTMERIVDKPARTTAGVRAKAHAARRMVERGTLDSLHVPQDEQLAAADIEARMMWSLAQDILRGSAAV